MLKFQLLRQTNNSFSVRIKIKTNKQKSLLKNITSYEGLCLFLKYEKISHFG